MSSSWKIPNLHTKFHENCFLNFQAVLLITRQTDRRTVRQTNMSDNMTSLMEETRQICYFSNLRNARWQIGMFCFSWNSDTIQYKQSMKDINEVTGCCREINEGVTAAGKVNSCQLSASYGSDHYRVIPPEISLFDNTSQYNPFQSTTTPQIALKALSSR